MAFPVTEKRNGDGTEPGRARGREAGQRSSAPGTPASRGSRGRRAATLLSWLYVLALLGLVAAFRMVGERWWVTAVALYVPRVVFMLPLPVLLLALGVTGSRRGFWLMLGGLLSLLLLLMGLVLPWPVRADPGAPVVRVLSYNVNSGGTGAADIVAEIDRFSPDLVFLEELGSAEKIAALLQTHYPSVRVAGQFLVASRFPVTSSIDPEKLQYAGRFRQPRWLEQIIETPLGPIAFYVVHPLSPREGFNALRGHGLKHEILSGRGFSEDSEDLVKNNSGLRALQVADFVEAASRETHPVVIAGDTNLPGLSYVLHRYLSRYQDGFSKAGWGFGYTFPTGYGGWMRIDRVFASDELQFVHFEVGRSHASDHDCVVADLQRAR